MKPCPEYYTCQNGKTYNAQRDDYYPCRTCHGKGEVTDRTWKKHRIQWSYWWQDMKRSPFYRLQTIHYQYNDWDAISCVSHKDIATFASRKAALMTKKRLERSDNLDYEYPLYRVVGPNGQVVYDENRDSGQAFGSTYYPGPDERY